MNKKSTREELRDDTPPPHTLDRININIERIVLGITSRLWRRRKPFPRFVPIRNIDSNCDGLLSESKI